MTSSTVPDLLDRLLRENSARPLVTFYDDATGERVELSVATYLNWVSKTANLAQDELDVGHGGLVLLDLPTHWQGAVWLAALWSIGACATTDPRLLSRADLVVCGPEGVRRHGANADRLPVVALSLRALGGQFSQALPTGVTDFGAVVLAQPDAFQPADPPLPNDRCWCDAETSLTQAEMLAAAQAAGGGARGRLLTDLNPCSPPGAQALVSVLVGRGSAVWVANADASGWEHRREQERATSVLRH